MITLMIIPWLGVISLSFLMAPLGCLLLWRRLTFFSDSLGHGALLGVVFSLTFHLPLGWGLTLIGLIYILFMQNNLQFGLPLESRLVALAYGCLSLGILWGTTLGPSFDPMAYLFGDILMVDLGDVAITSICAVLSCSMLKIYWPKILLTTLDEDLAASSGINVQRIHQIVMIITVIATSLGIKLVGALLIPAFLIIPAMTSHLIALNPSRMVIYAVIISLATGTLGLLTSMWGNWMVGPIMVLMSLSILMVIMVGQCGRRLIAHMSKKQSFNRQIPIIPIDSA